MFVMDTVIPCYMLGSGSGVLRYGGFEENYIGFDGIRSRKQNNEKCICPLHYKNSQWE